MLGNFSLQVPALVQAGRQKGCRPVNRDSPCSILAPSVCDLLCTELPWDKYLSEQLSFLLS